MLKNHRKLIMKEPGMRKSCRGLIRNWHRILIWALVIEEFKTLDMRSITQSQQ